MEERNPFFGVGAKALKNFAPCRFYNFDSLSYYFQFLSF